MAAVIGQPGGESGECCKNLFLKSVLIKRRVVTEKQFKFE